MMFRWDTRIFWKIIVAASLLSPFVLFSTAFKPTENRNLVAWLTNNLVYPLQYATEKTSDFFADSWDHYISLSEAAQENTELRHQIEVLKAELSDYEELTEEVKRLRQILNFNQHYRREHVIAEVISLPKTAPFQTLRVSKGTADGVEIGFPVISSQGVIGRIIKTGVFHSDVQLLTDANFYLDVLLQRTRVRGVLRGGFRSQCTLKLNRAAEIKIGDTVVTSGLVGGFPKGIPVGRVMRITYELDNITQAITLEPWVKPFQIEQVIILKTIDDHTQKILNTAGGAWLKQSIDTASRGPG